MRRALIVAVLAGVGLIGGGTAFAHPAQPRGDGIIDVAIENIVIANDRPVGEAAKIAAPICNVDEARVRNLARSVDDTGKEQVVCRLAGGRDVRLLDNR